MSKITSYIEMVTLFETGNSIREKTFSEIIFEGNTFRKSIAFSGCKFEEVLSLSDVTFLGNVDFKECEFEQDVEFLASFFKGNLTFVDCKIKKQLKVISSELKQLRLEECKCDDVVFGGIIEGESIDFNTGDYEKIDFCCERITSKVLISANSIKRLTLSECVFSEDFKLDNTNLRIEFFDVEKCDFKGRLDFTKGEISESFFLSMVNFYDTVLISDLFKIGMAHFSSIYAKYIFSIKYNANVESLTLNDSVFEGDFACSEPYDKQYIEGDLSINITGVIKGKLIFENISISSLGIEGAVNFGVVLIKNIKVIYFTLIDFFNLNQLILSDLNPRGIGCFIVSESSVGRTEFLNTNLNKFAETVIVNSNVSEIVLSNSRIPDKIQIRNEDRRIGYGPSINEIKSDATFYRETYRQLRKAFQNQGNQKEAYNYKSKELYYLNKELPFGWDKILLWLNYISNNHGISWFRGVCFTLLIAAFFFIIYNETLVNKGFEWSFNSNLSSTWLVFQLQLDKYVEFLLSFPKVIIEGEPINKSLSGVIVLLARIFMSYGIYQTISAFRKYGKL